ncbi:MAG: HD domain-containing protein [Candidatus Omnitrophica bacterium]|nr:HD domain-containing protein [Candidatus Omnitrophota bacterium]
MEKKSSIRAGVIDIGSSSIKLVIAERAAENIKIIESLRTAIPIGKHTFFKERISQETTNQTINILERYKQVLKEYEITEVMVIATTAVREARNKDIYLDAVLRKTGLNIEVLTAGDIVYYIDCYLYHRLKDTYPIHTKNLLIAELGAGSLDISVMEKGFTLMNLGLPLGTIRLKQLMSKLGGSSQENYEAVREYIENEFAYLKRGIPQITLDDIILIDENYYQHLQNILPNKKRESQFFQVSIEDTEAVISQILDKSSEELSRLYKIPLENADSVMGYAVILNLFFTLIANRNLYVLETSLAQAVLANILLDLEFSPKYNKTNQLISVANFLCSKYNVDINHAKKVAELCDTLFDNLKDQLGLKKKDSLYLILAAYLHDIGMFIHNRSHHKHAEYIISSLNLFRLTEEEIKMIACIARYHRKIPPMENHILYKSLSLDKQVLVQKLSVILRVANALDRSHKQKVKSMEINFGKNNDVTLVVKVEGNFILEKGEFLEKKELFEELTGNKINLSVKNI